MLTCTAIVTCPRGSWRWQSAYKVVRYTPRQTKDGRWIWASANVVVGKSSLPQLRRMGWDGPVGGMHNVPLTPEEVLQYTRDKTSADLATTVN